MSESDPLKVAIAALVAANGRLAVDRSDAAYAEWHAAVDEVKRLHVAVEQRALERARRVRQ